MTRRRLRLKVLSDIHLGHRRTDTDSIIKNLKKALPDTSESDDLDLIFITGDVFDRLFSLHDPAIYEIHSWFSRLLRMCKRRNIVLRVLEGTPSHDWKQCRLLNNINIDAGINADAKHVSTLSIEHIDSLDIDVLYVPDEWSVDSDDTWKQVQALLVESKLTSIDFTLLHGCYQYQLPPHVQTSTHEPDRYCDITKHYVFTGHVHITSRYKNIIVPGSFDRLAHNEEGDKGDYHITVVDDGDDSVIFVKNKSAKTYLTLDCRGLNVDDALGKVTSTVKSIPPESHIRLQALESDVISGSLDILRKKYPSIRWSTKIVSNDKSKNNNIILSDMRATYKTVPITKSSIVELVKNQLISMDCNDSSIDDCLNALAEVI